MSSSNQNKTRVAIVGAGYIADNHVHALRELPFVDVCAVCDPNRQQADSLARRWKIPGVFGDIAAMLAENPPDVAHLLVPPPLHAALTRELLEGGVGVLVEKPMALTSEECRELTELARQNKVALGVNHNMCFHPAFAELERRLRANEIGPPQFVVSITNLPLRQLATKQYGHWMFRRAENILFEIGCHPFSMVHAVLGNIRSASTLVSDTFDVGGVPFHKSWRSMIDCERGIGSAYISVGREFLASSLLVIGPDGSLEADLVTGSVIQGRKTKWPDFYDLTINNKKNAKSLAKSGRRNFWNYLLSLFKLKSRSDLFYVTMRDSIRNFHEAVRDGREPRVSGLVGAEVVRFCETVAADRRDVTPPSPSATRAKLPATAASEARANKPVLVTGGTGFIGSHLVERLCARGIEVRALARSTAYKPAWFEHPLVEVVEGDVTRTEDVANAVAGTSAVMHLATALFDSWPETEQGNVVPTKAIAEACIAHGSRLIFTSTIAGLYVGDLTTSDRVTHEHRVDPKPAGRSLYARGKIACEHMLFAMQKDGLELVVFRPGLVVGPRGRTRHSGVGYWPQDNHCLSWGAGEHPLPFVLASDVADALIAALDEDAALGQSFNLVGEVRMTGREYVQELAKRSGRPIEFHRQSLLLAQCSDIFKWGVKVVIRKPGNSFPSHRDLKTRALRPWFDCSAARDTLGWRPETDRDRFLVEALDIPLDQGA